MNLISNLFWGSCFFFSKYQYMYYQDSVISSMPTGNLLQPLPPEENTKLIFRDKTTGNNIPKSYIPAIERVRLSRKKNETIKQICFFLYVHAPLYFNLIIVRVHHSFSTRTPILMINNIFSFLKGDLKALGLHIKRC